MQRSTLWTYLTLATVAWLSGLGTAWGQGSSTAAEYVAYRDDPAFELPRIIIQHDPARGVGFDFTKAMALYVINGSEAGRLRDAAIVLQESITRMTGKTLTIASDKDISRGIVLTTLAGAPELANDAEIKRALANDGKDSYNHIEAFFIRSEPARLLIVANTAEGLIAAVPEVLESVGYEVLGMGPNWVHVPSDHQHKLAFSLRKAGRPSYYLRQLSPTSGQYYGIGTLFNTKLPDAADESVDVSYKRWAVGSRLAGASMPGFPGHALQAYHKAVVEEMLKTGQPQGFLAQTTLGEDAKRPEASAERSGDLWINTDAQGEAKGKVFLCDAKKWNQANLAEIGTNLDLSLPFVRQVILDDMKAKAQVHFATFPDQVFVFGTDPEDGGGYAVLEKMLANPTWYPQYLAAQGIAFGQPYVLHGYQGLDQPKEIWDPAAPSDTVFGFNNWLLREYDAWIDSLPQPQRVTTSGQSKKALARTSLYCYNYHDVPPNFNLDPRIRVMIAGYPKHRGRDKWKAFASQRDMARSYQVQLPREPSGEYRIISLAYYWDMGLEGIPATWSAQPARIIEDLTATRKAGIKALTCEIDFNFGKFGLAYYLLGKALWDTSLSAKQLDALRDRWLQRAFGSAWREMKAYYDYMLVDNYPVNGRNAWATAVRLIDAADKKLDPSKEPQAKVRLDDLKQFWYFHYLLDTDQAKPDSPALAEFVWKGQMSYMTAMHAVVRKIFGKNAPTEAAPEALTKGPAHYSRTETAGWWQKVLEHWPLTVVDHFVDATLANGKKAKDIDPNDLVQVDELASITVSSAFLYNSGYMKPASFVVVARKAGDPVGFSLAWPQGDNPNDAYYVAKDLPYSIDRWDTATRNWEPWLDKAGTNQPSRLEGKMHVVRVSRPAPQSGTYRISIGYGGNLSQLGPLDFDYTAGKAPSGQPMSYFDVLEGLTQAPVYIYVPKGTKSLDIEVWDNYNVKSVVLYAGLPSTNPKTRKVDIGARKTHRVALEPGEDGTIARIEGNGFNFPFIYSVPMYWAKSPSELLIPRAVAQADALTIK